MFVQPIVTVIIYYCVFQLGFKSAPPSGTNAPYVLWLIPGIVPWFYFNEAVNINLIFVLTILIMLIISVCIVSILFVKGSFNTKNNGKGLNFENIRKKFFKINGSTKLINGELFKYFIQNKLICIICSIIFPF